MSSLCVHSTASGHLLIDCRSVPVLGTPRTPRLHLSPHPVPVCVYVCVYMCVYMCLPFTTICSQIFVVFTTKPQNPVFQHRTIPQHYTYSQIQPCFSNIEPHTYMYPYMTSSPPESTHEEVSLTSGQRWKIRPPPPPPHNTSLEVH